MGRRQKKSNKKVKAMDNTVPVETVDVEGTVCNVYSQELTWKIDHYQIEKPYSVNFAMPCGIECTLGLYPSKALSWRVKEGNRKPSNHTSVHPILFITKIQNADDHYKFKLKIIPTGKAVASFGLPLYTPVAIRPEGYKGFGPLMNSHNLRNFLDREGNLTLKIDITLKDVDRCKPFDRQDYTIERSVLAKNMTKLFMSELASDVSILLDEEKIPAHKVILAAHSSVFAKILEDANVTELTIKMCAPREAYIELFRFIYNNTIKDLKTYLEPLIKLATDYDVQGLRTLCHLELIRVIRVKFNKISPNSQVPSHIVANDEKALRFYKALQEVEAIMNEDRVQQPTSSSSSSSLEDDMIPPPPPSFPSEPIEEIPLKANIEFPPPPTPEEQAAMMNEDIFTSSMTNFFTNTLSPIMEAIESDNFESSEVCEKSSKDIPDVVIESVVEEILQSVDGQESENELETQEKDDNEGPAEKFMDDNQITEADKNDEIIIPEKTEVIGSLAQEINVESIEDDNQISEADKNDEIIIPEKTQVIEETVSVKESINDDKLETPSEIQDKMPVDEESVENKQEAPLKTEHQE